MPSAELEATPRPLRIGLSARLMHDPPPVDWDGVYVAATK